MGKDIADGAAEPASGLGGFARGYAIVARGLRVSMLAVLVALLLSACAGSVTAPSVVQAMAPEKKSGARISDVTAEAAPGIAMTQYDFDRISAEVKAEIASAVPGALVATGTPADRPPMKIKLFFTQYDGGNAFARLMLAGLGQIRITGNVTFVDGATGEIVGKYEVSKIFSFGGIYGATTRIEDVEVGFAKSVAEILKDKKS